MSNQQLYFALGVPVLIYLFGFTVTIFLTFWQTKELREIIRELRDDMRSLRVQIDLIMSKLSDLDTRVAILEERSQ